VTTTAKAKGSVSRNGSSAAASPGALKEELVAYLRQGREELRGEWVRAMTASGDLWLDSLTAREQELESVKVYDTCVDSLDSGSYLGAEEFAARMARRAAVGAVSPERFLGGMLALRDVYGRGLLRRFAKEPDRLNAALGIFESVANRILVIVAMSFNTERERVVRQQQEAIRELSTPVLQVRDGLLILPIIGLIDSDRARQLTEQLLDSIRRFRARVVVMDITGVAAVDSKVANHLIQTVDAARLLGTIVILTGVSPATAQTIVTVGVDLSRMQTVGDLQGGIEVADRLLGYRVIAGDPGAAPIVPATVV
jgi:rsbT co-antagonist protein RsbR